MTVATSHQIVARALGLLLPSAGARRTRRQRLHHVHLRSRRRPGRLLGRLLRVRRVRHRLGPFVAKKIVRGWPVPADHDECVTACRRLRAGFLHAPALHEVACRPHIRSARPAAPCSTARTCATHRSGPFPALVIVDDRESPHRLIDVQDTVSNSAISPSVPSLLEPPHGTVHRGADSNTEIQQLRPQGAPTCVGAGVSDHAMGPIRARGVGGGQRARAGQRKRPESWAQTLCHLPSRLITKPVTTGDIDPRATGCATVSPSPAMPLQPSVYTGLSEARERTAPTPQSLSFQAAACSSASALTSWCVGSYG